MYNNTTFRQSTFNKLIVLIALSLGIMAIVIPASGYSSDISLPSNVLSYILSFLSFGVISFSLYFFNNEFSLSSNKSTALISIYLLLALANPVSILFSTYHIVTILLIWALYFTGRFYFLEKNKTPFFMAILLSSIASVIYEPLFWLSVVLFILGIFHSRLAFLKLLAIFVIALILPFIYLVSYFYMFTEVNILQYLNQFFLRIVDVNILSAFSNIEYVVYVLLILLILLITTSNIRKKYTSLRNVQRAGYRSSSVFSVGLILISFVFRASYSTPLDLFLFLPLSILIFNYLNNNPYRGKSKVMIIFMILFVVAYRISFYIDFAKLLSEYI